MIPGVLIMHQQLDTTIHSPNNKGQELTFLHPPQMKSFPVALCTYQIVLTDPSLLPFPFLQFSFLSPEALQL